jgi:hypothetical protein
LPVDDVWLLVWCFFDLCFEVMPVAESSCDGPAVGAAVAFDELPDEVCAIAPVAAKRPAVKAIKSVLLLILKLLSNYSLMLQAVEKQLKSNTARPTARESVNGADAAPCGTAQ